MKRIIILTFILFAQVALGTECIRAPNSLNPIDHWEKASDVLFGKVVEGRLINEVWSGEVQVTFEITKALKGDKSGDVKIISSMYEHFAVGYSYIVYLYGGNKLVPCAMVIELMPAINDMEELYYQSQRDDVGFGNDLRKILQHVGYKP